MKKDNFEKIFSLEYSKLNGLITSYLIYNYVCELETSFSIEYSIRKSEV